MEMDLDTFEDIDVKREAWRCLDVQQSLSIRNSVLQCMFNNSVMQQLINDLVLSHSDGCSW